MVTGAGRAQVRIAKMELAFSKAEPAVNLGDGEGSAQHSRSELGQRDLNR